MFNNIITNMYVKVHFLSVSNKISHKDVWERAFINYFKDARYSWKKSSKSMMIEKKYLLKGFTYRQLKRVKQYGGDECSESDKSIPILICVLKNELEKLPLFLLHYRKLGIKKFVFIDNMSSDGTLEYLKEQKDAEIYIAKKKFQGYIKEGWINQVLARQGFHRWYLVVDADELLVWPQVEQKSLAEMIQTFQYYKQYRPLAIMTDMYRAGRTYQKKTGNIQEEYCYFDKDTYSWLENKDVDLLIGGPRKRKCRSVVWLSKTPLFYLRPLELLCSAHFLYPYQKHKEPRCPLVLLHYKFAYEESWNNMREYIKNGADKNRIEESAACLRGRGKSFYYEGSEKLDYMKKLLEIPFVIDIKLKSEE